MADPIVSTQRHTRPYLFIALLVIAAVLPGLPSLWGEFVWDDRKVILLNPFWHAESHPWANVWTRDYGLELTGQAAGYYRPFTSVSILATIELAGQTNAFPFRLTNLLLHAANALLLWLLARQLFRFPVFRVRDPELSSMASAIIFASAGWNAETIAFVTARADSLALMFLLLGSLVLVHVFNCQPATDSPARQFGVWVFAALSVLSAVLAKETAALYLFCVPVIVILVAQRFQSVVRLFTRLLVFCFVMLASYATVRLLSGVSSPASPKGQLSVQYAATGFGGYLLQSMMPSDILIIQPDQKLSPLFLQHNRLLALPVGIFTLLLLIVGGKTRPRIALAGLAWMAFFMTPPLYLHATKAYLVGERFLYIPAVGICVLAGMGIGDLICAATKRKRLYILLLCAWVISHAFWVCDKTLVWSTEANFWRRVVHINPQLADADLNYALALWRADQFAEAERLLKAALVNNHSPEKEAAIRQALALVAQKASHTTDATTSLTAITD